MTQVHLLECLFLFVDLILLMGCLLVDVQVMASSVVAELLALSFGPFLLKETYLILIFSIHFPSHPSHFDVFYAYSGV